jgi:hypothetical protein
MNLAPAASKARGLHVSTCSRSSILRCPSVGYFVPVSSLRGASSDRTIAACAIRSRFLRYPLGWSAINLGIAVPGLLALRKEARTPRDIADMLAAQRRTEALYLINTGLDLGYMGLGLWMQERGLRTAGENGARLRGFGNAVLVQGAFLFAYDLVAYVAHSLHWQRKRDGLLRQLQFNGTSLSLRF